MSDKKYPPLKIKNLSGRKRDSDCNPDLPQKPFAMAVVGPSRAGKSCFIKNLLTRKDMIKPMFKPEHVFIICPSIRYNDDYKMLDQAQKFEEYSNAILREIMKEQDLVIQTFGIKRTPDILIVMDDCFDNPSFNRSQIVKTLAMRGRHMKISLIMSGQKWSMITKAARINLTDVAFFRPSNFSELQFFVEELTDKATRKELIAVTKKIYEEPYQFIYFDLLNPDMSRRIRHGMSKPVDFSFL